MPGIGTAWQQSSAQCTTRWSTAGYHSRLQRAANLKSETACPKCANQHPTSWVCSQARLASCGAASSCAATIHPKMHMGARSAAGRSRAKPAHGDARLPMSISVGSHYKSEHGRSVATVVPRAEHACAHRRKMRCRLAVNAHMSLRTAGASREKKCWVRPRPKYRSHVGRQLVRWAGRRSPAPPLAWRLWLRRILTRATCRAELGQGAPSQHIITHLLISTL